MIALSLALLVAANSQPFDRRVFESGRSKAEVVRAWQTVGEIVEWTSAEPQGLRRALLDEPFLATLNRFRRAPLEESKAFDARAFHAMVQLKSAAATSIASFDRQDRLTFIFSRITVELMADPSGSDRFLMNPLRTLLAAFDDLGFTLAPEKKDEWGNAFTWQGRHRDGRRLACWYVPDADELRVLVY